LLPAAEIRIDHPDLRPPAKKPPEPPALSVTGQWDLHIDFLAGSADHALVLEQSGARLAGTHFGKFANRDLTGTMEGNRIVMRSSYTRQGVRLNFAFEGTVEGDTMQGTVSLGEYGVARWNARKHSYAGAGARRRL
jgi:D-glucosaminate-6-phosphate ammonia-lyase